MNNYAENFVETKTKIKETAFYLKGKLKVSQKS